MADWQTILCVSAMGVAVIINLVLSIILAIFQNRLRKRGVPVVDVNFMAIWPGENYGRCVLCSPWIPKGQMTRCSIGYAGCGNGPA